MTIPLKIARYYPVVSDERESLGDDLTEIARIGKRFDIAVHARCEDELADAFFFRAERKALKYASILKNQFCLFHFKSLYITALIVWRRFSASSKTIDAPLSKTSSVTSSAVRPNFSQTAFPISVFVS